MHIPQPAGMRPRPTRSRRGVSKGPAAWRASRRQGARRQGRFEELLSAWQSGAYSVLDFHSAHDGESSEYQPLVHPCPRGSGRILKSAQERQALGDHGPVFRYPDLNSAPPGKNVDHSLLALNVRLPQINLAPTHDGRDLAT